MGKTFSTIGVALALTAAVLAGCGSKDGGSASGPGGEINLAMLVPATGDFFDPQADTFKRVAAENNATATVYVADYDTTKQSSQCQTAISLGKYDGLLTYGVNNATLAPCAKQAIAAGLKVVNLTNTLGPNFTSTEIQVPGLSGQVIIPYAKEAAATVDLVRGACSGIDSCQVALLVGDPAGNYSSEKARIAKEELSKVGIDVVGQATTGFFSPAAAVSATKSLLVANPQLNVVVVDDDSNLAGIIKEQEAGRIPAGLKLVGDGGRKEVLDAIRQDKVFGTIYYSPQTLAQEATEMLIKAVRNEPIADNNITMDELPPKIITVTKDNVDQVEPQW